MDRAKIPLVSTYQIIFSSKTHDSFNFEFISTNSASISKLYLILSRRFQIMGIAKRGGHRLKAIYVNFSEFNINFFIKHTVSVSDKLTEIKKPPENLFASTPRDTKHQLTRPFAIVSNNSPIG